jgi:hypothetical protein
MLLRANWQKRRSLFNVAAAMSLLLSVYWIVRTKEGGSQMRLSVVMVLCFVTVALWVRTYFAVDGINRFGPGLVRVIVPETGHSLTVGVGGVLRPPAARNVSKPGGSRLS